MRSDYEFIQTDTTALVNALIAAYEKMTGVTVHPASPERLFIAWVADIIVQTRVSINYAANQNIPSRAVGANLDALAELFYTKHRPAAKAASCTVRFSVSEPQQSAILIPSGTRITDATNTLIWETSADSYILAGEASVDVPVRCQESGTVGNGYVAGQLNTVVDVFPYYIACSNINDTDGGTDAATDEEFFELLKASEDAYSTAGPMGAYIYWAKSVSTEIADVKAICPMVDGKLQAGQVAIYALMNDGTIATDTIKALILAACNDDKVRPLTDLVSVKDPEKVPYDISLTYYIPSDTTTSASEVQTQVESAVDAYIAWQCARLGRDINPSKLISLLMDAGVKRVEITAPAFRRLKDGSDHAVPEVATLRNRTITSGGYEDE
ncbi:MAG: baseplate J/gp47 family protein [Faecousia sp.]